MESYLLRMREIEKGFLNGPRSKKDDIDSKSGLSIQDLAKKIKNIDGKLIGKDGKQLKAIRGDPKPVGLGTKVAVEGSNMANVTKAAPHNPKDKPLKSILKTHGDSVNLNEGDDGCVRVEMDQTLKESIKESLIELIELNADQRMALFTLN
ncbi:hypothetical protein Tco_0566270 [Tanacetum coccineum]